MSDLSPQSEAKRTLIRSLPPNAILSRPSRANKLIRVRNDTLDGGEQRFELDRFDIELVAPHGNGLLALAVQRVRGHANDRDVTGLRVVLEGPHGFPAVNDRHFEVHQNYV